MSRPEVYISTDVETDGPIPGPYSMLSLGAAAFDESGVMLSTFSMNLKTLPGATQDPGTMKWWDEHREAYKATREHAADPAYVMGRYTGWVREQLGLPVFVGYPASFDFLFVYWYLIRFVGVSPFSFSAYDIKTAASVILKTRFRETTKKNMPKRWFSSHPHTHVAVDDAIGQGHLFVNMRKDIR